MPVSFLVDAKQQLAIVYRGPVEVDQVLADLKKLTLAGDAWAVAARPSLGRWNEPPALGSQLALATQFVNRGDIDVALDYVQRHQSSLSADKEFPTFLVWLGDQLITRGQPRLALEQYRAALLVDPTHLIAMNNLAWHRATHRDAAVRDGDDAVHWAERAARQTKAQDAGILDTLAAAYAEAGRFEEATKVMRQALALAQQSELPELVPRFNERAEL